MTTKQPERAASLPMGSVHAPRFARLEKGVMYAASGAWVTRRAPRDLLHRFIQIAEAPKTRRLDEGERVERAASGFASQWGLVGLCQHGLPAGHNSSCKPVDTVEGHRQFALCLDALLRIGLSLNAGHCADDIDWEFVDFHLSGPDFPPHTRAREFWPPSSLVLGRTHLQIMMQRLLTISWVQPRFNWSSGGWAIDFDSYHGSNLAAILVTQLMAALGGKAMRKCRDCPRWFTPAGRQVYCRVCGIRAAWRHAAAKKRARDTLVDSLVTRNEKGAKKRQKRGK